MHNTKIAALFLAAVAFTGCSKEAPPPPKAAVPVVVTTVAQQTVPVEVRAIGNVEPYSTVQIKSQVNAQLDKVHFRQGDEVRKGQLLFTLDRRQLEADLKKAEGVLAKDEALLVSSQAKAARYAQLYKEGVVSKQEYDDVTAEAGSARATADADRAAVENQKVQLTYTSIYSPIDGRTGTLLINEGNLIKANDTPYLITINQISPVYVSFSLPEQQLAEVKRYAANRKLGVKAFIAGEKEPTEGELSFMDNTVDPGTGTIKLRATFQNRDHKLWPGQFVDTVMTLATQPNATLVPTVAVLNGAQGPYVYVVKDDSTAENRNVGVSRAYGSNSVIQSGLQPGERVVTDGQAKLQPGAKVEIKPAVQAASGIPQAATASEGSRP